MPSRLLTAILTTGLGLALTGGARAAPLVWKWGPLYKSRLGGTARGTIVEYFTASKNADAARATGLIDYEEWAKAKGLKGEDAKRFAKLHRADLAADYRAEKAAGSTKAFKIVKESVDNGQATFLVTQDRINGTYTWKVDVLYKNGQWAITGFTLTSIER